MLLSLTHSVSPQVGDIVGITRRRHRHICAIFQACCANFLPLDTRILFFCILLWKLNIRCMNRHPVSVGSRGGQTCFLMVFHASLRQILNCYFCAISLWELPVCAIFYAFFQLWLGGLWGANLESGNTITRRREHRVLKYNMMLYQLYMICFYNAYHTNIFW